MRKLFFVLFVLAFIAVTVDVCPGEAQAQTTFNPPDCILGNAPVKSDRKPAPGEWSFTAPKGGLVVMDFRTRGTSKIHQVLCRLPYDVESWAPAPGTPGRPWDTISGNNFDPVEWDIPVPQGFLNSLKGEKGDRGEGFNKEELKAALAQITRDFSPEKPALRVPRWHDPCTLTTTRKVVCTALAIGLGAAAASSLGKHESSCNYCNY